LNTFFLFTHRELVSKWMLSWNLAAYVACAGTVLCGCIVGENMVILYSPTQPHPLAWPAQRWHILSLNLALLMIAFSLIAYNFQCICFRLLSMKLINCPLSTEEPTKNSVHDTAWSKLLWSSLLWFILNVTLKFSQHLPLWNFGWKPCYAFIFSSAVHVFLCIIFWVLNSPLSGEIPANTTWCSDSFVWWQCA